MSGAILLFAASHSFPEYPFRRDQKTGGSLEFPGNLRALGKGGKGTELLGVTLQGVQDRMQRWVCGELLPALGLNSIQWGQTSGPSNCGTQARVADRLIDDGCSYSCSTPSSKTPLTYEGGAALTWSGSGPQTLWEASSYCPIMPAVSSLCPQSPESGQKVAG